MPALDRLELRIHSKYSSFPASGTALGTCQRCHASAAGEMTFSSLANVLNVPGQPIRFRNDDSWRDPKFLLNLKKSLPEIFEALVAPARPGPPRAARPARWHLPCRPGSMATRARIPAVTSSCPATCRRPGGSRPLPPRAGWPLGAAAAANPAFVATFPFASPTSDPRRFPGQWADHVVAGPKGAEAYITSDNCIGCHGGLGGAPSGLTMFVPTGKAYGEGYNVSEYGEWRWSPMGLAGRDPVFHSQVESELALLDAEFPPTGPHPPRPHWSISAWAATARWASASSRSTPWPATPQGHRQAAGPQLQARVLQPHHRPHLRGPEAEGL